MTVCEKTQCGSDWFLGPEHARTCTPTSTCVKRKATYTWPGTTPVRHRSSLQQHTSLSPCSGELFYHLLPSPVHTFPLALVLSPLISLCSLQGAAVAPAGFKEAMALLPYTARRVEQVSRQRGNKKHGRGEPHRGWSDSAETLTSSKKKQLYFTYIFKKKKSPGDSCK